MSKWAQLGLLIAILIIAAFLRLTNLDWDAYNHYHPDERYIAWVATTIELPHSLAKAFDPQDSTINPFYWPAIETTEGIVVEKDAPRRFAYGHVPLYVGVGATKLAEKLTPVLRRVAAEDWLFTQDLLNVANRNEFRHITAVGRATTALVDIAAVALLFFLGRTLFSPQAGLLAALLMAISVLHIQLSHFFAVDPYLSFFTLLTLTLLALSVKRTSNSKSRIAYLLVAGGAMGLAVGSKFSGILLLLPLTLAVLMQIQWRITRRILLLVLIIALSLFIFFVTNPFAILDSTCQTNGPYFIGPIEVPSILSQSCYLQNIVQQGSMVRGTRDVPFVRQYIGTIPFIYYLEMLYRWGLGPLLTLVGIGGFGWALWRLLRWLVGWWRGDSRREGLQSFLMVSQAESGRFPFSTGESILLTWALLFFVSNGLLLVKFPRYMLPLLPVIILFGAAMLLSIRIDFVRRLAIAIVLLFTGLYALAFLNVYRQPHPWIAASNWIYDNIDPGMTFVSEKWDDQLPDNLFEGDQIYRRSDYELREVNWLSGTEKNDDVTKLRENLEILAEADFIVLSSNRNYGVIPRLPERYPLSSQYYQMLFDGSLGYEVAYVTTRMPNLFGFHLKPDSFTWPGLLPPEEVIAYLKEISGINWGRFDESFTVYDMPLVIILANREGYSAAEMEALFHIP